MEDEVSFDEFEREDDGARFAARSRIGSGFLVEVEKIVVVVNTESGVAKQVVAGEICLEDLKILLLVFFCDFGVIENFNLVLVVGDGLIDRSEFLIDFSDVFLASSEEIEAVASEEDVPGKKSFRGKLFVFE